MVMKKILLVFDGTNFSEGAFRFVKALNEIQPVLVTGVFTPQADYANLWSYAAAAAPAGSGVAYIPLVEGEEADAVEKNIARFESLCQKNDIRYRVHNDFFDFVLPELKKESRFTDLVVMSGEMFYEGADGHKFEYLREALHGTESPVVVVPEEFEFPQMNILAYDGSAGSMYAIKQFAYIFPEFAKNKTVLVYAEDKEEKDFPSKAQMIELVTQHFPDLELYKLEVDPKRYFNTWLMEKRACILVSGSFSRGGFSELFKKSFVTDVIADKKFPVFIAHK
jgi:hypothetical protein